MPLALGPVDVQVLRDQVAAPERGPRGAGGQLLLDPLVQVLRGGGRPLRLPEPAGLDRGLEAMPGTPELADGAVVRVAHHREGVDVPVRVLGRVEVPWGDMPGLRQHQPGLRRHQGRQRLPGGLPALAPLVPPLRPPDLERRPAALRDVQELQLALERLHRQLAQHPLQHVLGQARRR
eukprot:CAMPEP_0179338160 /NCGR_PEP_ID=MMETSP0797-20121207/68030_1 /TAXON_ID=47934 /ORGANISM="Dinophysis acuminata, Strain DAEP01" /LENGTH=177 /DNA_ID=CAMNT_0021051899 /DNA_START=157 /DNA_END=686 /DNA_ORIENTATION=-